MSLKQIVHQETKSFISFSKKHKSLLYFVFAFSFFTYFPKIFFYDYSIDTEKMIRFPQETLNWWLQLGRYGLVFLKKLTFFSLDTNIIFINLVTYILLAIGCFFLCFLICRILTNSPPPLLLITISSLYLSTPLFLEQTNFVLQSIEITLAIILLYLAMYLLYLAFSVRKWFLSILGGLLSLFTFSIYPSLQITYIVLAIMIVQSTNNRSFKNYLQDGVRYFIVFISSMGMNELLSKIILSLNHLQPSGYLLETSAVGKIPVRALLAKIWLSFRLQFLHKSNHLLIIFTILLLLAIIVIGIKKLPFTEKIIQLLSIFLLSLLCWSPFFILGYIGPLRTLVPTIPIVMCYLFAIIFDSLKKTNCRIAFILVGLIFSAAQVKTTIDFGTTEYIKYQREVTLAQEIKTALLEHGITDSSKYKLAILGSRSFSDPQIIKGDVLGKSFFEWDAKSTVGTSERVSDFLYTQGIITQRISVPEYQLALKQKNKLTVFPQKNSLKVLDDVIILKLSEPPYP